MYKLANITNWIKQQTHEFAHVSCLLDGYFYGPLSAYFCCQKKKVRIIVHLKIPTTKVCRYAIGNTSVDIITDQIPNQ